MYELSRVRLHSVGPSAARYQDVTLDLRDVGNPVPRAHSSATLFEPEGALVRRPSPASVLFAENGNGKTVLVKLIFSVMLPGRKQIVGTSNTKAMDNFILAEDVAHVALEWMHVETGKLAVTGKVSAWRDHRVSNDSARLTEAWYAFRPSADFTLDDLPFTDNGRLVGLSGFRDRLSEAAADHPHLEMAWETQHREWTHKLENLELDPELFAYQRRMNAGEGEAASAFSFKSDEAFTDWLLTSVLDKEGPRSLSEVIDAYANRLAERDDVLAEHDFVEGALNRLTPLATAARDHTAAQDIQAEAARDATRVATALELRHREEQTRLARLHEERTALGAQVEAADREQRRFNRIVLELRRIVAGLRLADARRKEDELKEERHKAQTALDAWHATGTLLRFTEAHQQANAIRALIQEHTTAAQGPLAARDAAARALVHGLIHAAEAADSQATEAETEAASLEELITNAATEDTDHVQQAEQFKAAANAAQEKITTLNARIEHAVSDGLLAPGEGLPQAAQRHETTAHAAETLLVDTEEAAARLRQERRRAETTLRDLTAEATQTRRTFDDTASRHDTAQQATTSLAQEPRFSALLGTDSILLETDATALDERLGQTLEDSERIRIELQTADREDQRVLDALGSGGLLPPPPAVSDVRDALRAAGVACYSGWEYLAQMPETERDTALRLYPHLVDGVVLNNPAQADVAQAHLAQARLLPSAAVVVGATTTFEHLDGSPPTGLAFLVTPNPALYDEELAEAERVRIEANKADRLARLVELETQINNDRALRLRLTQWREAYPPGTLAALTDAKDAAETAHQLAEQRVTEATTALDDLTRQEDETDQALPNLRAEANSARRSAEQVANLAAEATHLGVWNEHVRTNRDNALLAERTAQAARRRAEQLRTRQKATVRRQDDHKRVAAAHRTEIGQTPGAATVDTTGAPPTETIETLRSAYRAAVSAYEKVQVGADLKADLDSKEHTEAAAQETVEQLPRTIRDLATELLSSPDGGDAPARQAATQRAQRTVNGLDDDIQEAGSEVKLLQYQYEDFQPQETTLDPYGQPTSVAHGEELTAQATTDWNAAQARHSEVRSRADALQTTIGVVDRETEAFANLVETLRDSLPEEPADPETHPTFAGALTDATTRRNDVRDALREADTFLDQTTTAIRATSDELTRYANDDRFSNVNSPVRRQIRSVPTDRLHEYGPDWEEALKPRLRSLKDELAQIDRHRNQIILNLRGHVDTALRTLKAAERVSQLPETLNEWAGQHFLHIRFRDPDPTTLNEHLAAVIDAVVDPKKGGGKRDGMSIVLKGVRAALPHGVKVSMLKPDSTLRTERVRISEVSDVFSGGQELTAAIILYCTMAALRANDRGRVRQKHAGVLFLDNPIGRASASYLLELQLGVARALGVQLIYTTGLFDVNALSVFPLIIRLRNDQDVRSGKRYLTVEDEIRRHLVALDDPDGTGRISAARLYRRPTEQSNSPADPTGQTGTEPVA